MRFAMLVLGIMCMGAFLFNSIGCETSQPGTTDTLGTYTTHLDAAPDAVTTAAQKACEDLKLADIQGNGTKVDGQVTAQTADGTAVTINISQDGDNVSKVSIRVGTTGDQSISQQLVDRMKSHLSWL